MIIRIMSDLTKSVVNMVIVVSVVGFLLAGGCLVKLWRNRP